MAFFLRLPGALAVLLFVQCSLNTVVAQDAGGLSGFGDTVKVLGAMERTVQTFKDGFALNLVSPKDRTLVVKQNNSPLPAQFISGTTGEPFVPLSKYSYIIKMNETADDLIAEIRIAYDTAILTSMGVQEANTYVAIMASHGKSWVVDDRTRILQHSENNSRIIQITSLDGEYMLLGRQTVGMSKDPIQHGQRVLGKRTVDTSKAFLQYGQGVNRAIKVIGGTVNQQTEFVDRFRFNVQTNATMTMNVNIKEGVNPGTLPANTQSLNSFMWIVSTSSPFTKLNAMMQVPFNRTLLVEMRPAGSSPSTMLTVAKRALNATSGQFLPVNPGVQVVKELPEDRIEVPAMNQLDGQYIILVTEPKQMGATLSASNIVGGGTRRKRGGSVLELV